MGRLVSPDDELDPDEEGLAEEFIHHELMNEARAYVERGRKLQTLTNDEILDTWTALFERRFDSKAAEIARDMNDAATEIRLRGIEMPYERVKDKTRALEAEFIRQGSEDSSLRSSWS